MKTILKITSAIAIVIMIILTPTACKKENMMGAMTVAMTDAPAQYSEVNVDVTGLQIHHENAGWMNLQINTGIYNLLELQNNVNVILANNVQIPIGKITQIRLILGERNSIVDSLGTYPLKVPSGSESGLKINMNQTIVANNSVFILLDFDANASVVVHGNGSFSLKPVIKIKSVIQS